MLANSASGETSLPHTDGCLPTVCSHGLTSAHSGERAPGSPPLPVRTPVLQDQGPPRSPFPKVSAPNTVTLGLRASTGGLWGDVNQSITRSMILGAF